MSKAKQTALAGLLERARQFLEDLPMEGVSPGPVVQKLREAVQFLWLGGRGFSQNRCPVRAAALSYTTLLALVPLLAVVLSISKNILHDSSADLVPKLMDKMVSVVAPELEFMPMPESTAGPPAPGQAVVSRRARQEAVTEIQNFIDNIHAGTLGVVGSAFLFVVAIRLLMTIEQTFNDIWGIAHGRSICRKVVYYWTTITLGPLLLVLAMYLTGRAVDRILAGVCANAEHAGTPKRRDRWWHLRRHVVATQQSAQHLVRLTRGHVQQDLRRAWNHPGAPRRPLLFVANCVARGPSVLRCAEHPFVFAATRQ